MGMIKLRMAQESDVLELAALAYAYVEDDAVCNSVEGIREYLQNSQDIVCIAEDKGKLIGYCCGRISRHMSFKEPIADVVELFLSEDYRGKGIGKQLLSGIEAEFVKCGVNRVRILVREGSETARKFYLACGYDEYNMVMCRKDCTVTS